MGQNADATIKMLVESEVQSSSELVMAAACSCYGPFDVAFLAEFRVYGFRAVFGRLTELL